MRRPQQQINIIKEYTSVMHTGIHERIVGACQYRSAALHKMNTVPHATALIGRFDVGSFVWVAAALDVFFFILLRLELWRSVRINR